jgi:hypothetical protein
MAQENNAPALEPIEVLSKRLATVPWVFAGVCEANGWGTGKVMTEEEYKAAVSAWLKMPMAGKKG